ncbi:hypothetical protein CIB48_g2095 [Xylaria polymorpha]|nr:hypothetical protein CIB48_g2095 [Xylaria polymorpha]
MQCDTLSDLLRHVGAPTTLDLIAVLPSRQSTATGKIEESLGSGISLQACLFREEYDNPPSSYIIRSVATDSRTIINYNVLPEMTCDDISRTADAMNLEGNTLYHFEGRIPDVTLQCLKYLRRSQAGVCISVELEKPARDRATGTTTLKSVFERKPSWPRMPYFYAVLGMNRVRVLWSLTQTLTAAPRISSRTIEGD